MKSFRIPPGRDVDYFSGVLEPARPLVLADRIRTSTAAVTVILCPRLTNARALMATVPQFTELAGKGSGEITWSLLPPPPPPEDPDDPIPERLREELECDRLTSLTSLANFATSPPTGGHLAILTTPDGLFADVPKMQELAKRELRLQEGAEVDFEQLKQQLGEDLDYFAEAVCERPGQFAVRGGLIDVYPLNASAPLRLDFFGDELDSIRVFDPTSQRSKESLKEVTIAARNATASTTGRHAIFSYFAEQVS